MSDEVQQQDRSLPCPSGGFLKRLAQWNDRHSNACHGDAWCDLLEVVMHGEQEARHEGVPDTQDVTRSVNSASDDLVRRLRHGENYDGQEAADLIEQDQQIKESQSNQIKGLITRIEQLEEQYRRIEKSHVGLERELTERDKALNQMREWQRASNFREMELRGELAEARAVIPRNECPAEGGGSFCECPCHDAVKGERVG